jgi:hypothetical protein
VQGNILQGPTVQGHIGAKIYGSGFVITEADGTGTYRGGGPCWSDIVCRRHIVRGYKVYRIYGAGTCRDSTYDAGAYRGR